MDPVAPMSREVTLEVLDGLLKEAIDFDDDLKDAGDMQSAVAKGLDRFEIFMRETGLNQDALLEYLRDDCDRTKQMMRVMLGPIMTDDMLDPFLTTQLMQGILMGYQLRKWCDERKCDG